MVKGILYDEWTDEQCYLCDAMLYISEECYCSGWKSGLEFAIWDAIKNGDRRYGMGEMDGTQLERCKELSQELNGWIVWSEEYEFMFVTMEQWLEIYARAGND